MSLEWKLGYVGRVVCLITYSSASECKGDAGVTLSYETMHRASPLTALFNYMFQQYCNVRKANTHFQKHLPSRKQNSFCLVYSQTETKWIKN
jgi:hypothetical protein